MEVELGASPPPNEELSCKRLASCSYRELHVGVWDTSWGVWSGLQAAEAERAAGH